MLTQKELKRQYHYDPLTGLFTYLVGNQLVKPGTIVKPKATGYVVVSVLGKQYYAQRLAMLYMTGLMPEKHVEIDHIDGIRDNNKFSNLRTASRAENARNSKMYANNKSGYKGVDFHQNRYRARIWVGTNPNRVRLYLGSYDTPEEASIVYNKAAEMYHSYFYNDTTRYPRT